MHSHELFHIFQFLKNKELDELYLCVALKYLAVSMIGVFIPIYLITQGYSLFYVLLFFTLMSFSHMIGVLFAAKISCKIGFKHSILLSVPFLLAFYILLDLLSQFPFLFFITAILYGIQSSMFWTAFHTDFTHFSEKKTLGKSVGFVKLVVKLSNVFGPLVGGLVITFFGFNTLFLIVSALLLFSTIPLFFTKDSSSRHVFSVTNLFKGKRLRDYLGLAGFGIESTGAILWPIFIFFLVFNNFAEVGVVTSLSLFVSVLFILFIGFFSDLRRKLLMRFGSVFNSFVWVLRTFSITSLLVFISNSLYGFSKMASTIPFDALSYDKATKFDRRLEFTAFREFAIHSARVFTFASLAVFTYFLSKWFLIADNQFYIVSVVSFLLCAVGSLFFWFFS